MLKICVQFSFEYRHHQTTIPSILLVIATVDFERIDVFEERGFVVAGQLCDGQ